MFRDARYETKCELYRFRLDQILPGATWMQDHLSLIGDKKLNEICLVGAHNAGMSTITSKTAFANECSTLCQSPSVGFPNIIYLDNIINTDPVVLAMALNFLIINP